MCGGGAFALCLEASLFSFLSLTPAAVVDPHPVRPTQAKLVQLERSFNYASSSQGMPDTQLRQLLDGQSVKVRAARCDGWRLPPASVHGATLHRAVLHSAETLKLGSARVRWPAALRCALQSVLLHLDDLTMVLAPFLHGARYSSYGRHFTSKDLLHTVADRCGGLVVGQRAAAAGTGGGSGS